VIDMHCHLDLEVFDADRDAVIARARTAGVRGIVLPAIRPRTWPRTIAVARAYPEVRLALGVHPQIVPELAPEEIDDLEARLARAIEADGAVAVGECGLDGGTGARDLQEQLLRTHVRVARALGKPLVVHVLRAHDVACRIRRDERAGDVGGVLHSYSGGAALVPAYRSLGFRFSFAGPVTYPNARRPLEAARAVAPDELLAETDAPDQAPAERRGARNEPAFLGEVIAGLAAARGEPVADVAASTGANARRLFGDFGS
jgi:TatD DNase family protein